MTASKISLEKSKTEKKLPSLVFEEAGREVCMWREAKEALARKGGRVGTYES
jgi:hypothetical protein